MKNIKIFFKLIRVKQWVKNLFVFPAIIFAKDFLKKGTSSLEINFINVYLVVILFITFSLLSSAVYIINDIIDLKEDKNHPKKKNRPIASGAISISFAFLIFLILLFTVIALSFLVNTKTKIVLLIYLIINIAYTFYLKHIPVLDIFIIASGFLIRAIAGAVVIDANITKWFLITIFMLSLTIASVKRRGEYFIKEESRRKVLKEYNLEILDIFVSLSAISALLTYCIFALTYEIKSLYITIPPALYGIMRYLYISYVDIKKSDEPDDAIVKDPHLITTGFIYLITILLSMFIIH